MLGVLRIELSYIAFMKSIGSSVHLPVQLSIEITPLHF